MEPGTSTQEPPSVSRLTIASIALAAALVPLSSTMIAVALPHIADDFGITTGRAGVLVTVYLAAMLAGQPIAGRLSDALGARRTAIGALVGFGTCCIAAMFAGSFGMLVAARTGQAIFASALAPSSQSMIRTMVPAAGRGRAFGLVGSVMGIGAGTGPVVGGLVIALLGWHGIFAVNLPIVAVSLLAFRRLADDRQRRAARDRTAARAPIVNRTSSLSFGNQALSTVGQYALLLVVPIILDSRGWESIEVGLVLASLTLGMIVMSPIGGRLGDRRGDAGGRRAVVVGGTAATVAALAVLAVNGPALAVAVLVPALVAFGLGLGTVTPNLTTLALESVPEERVGLAAGLLSMSRYVGSIGTSVALGVLVGQGTEGVGALLWIALGASVAALVLALLLPRRGARRGGQPARAAVRPARTASSSSGANLPVGDST